MTHKELRALKLGSVIFAKGILTGMDDGEPLELTVTTIITHPFEVTFSMTYMGVPLGEIMAYPMNNEVFFEELA